MPSLSQLPPRDALLDVVGAGARTVGAYVLLTNNLTSFVSPSPAVLPPLLPSALRLMSFCLQERNRHELNVVFVGSHRSHKMLCTVVGLSSDVVVIFCCVPISFVLFLVATCALSENHVFPRAHLVLGAARFTPCGLPSHWACESNHCWRNPLWSGLGPVVATTWLQLGPNAESLKPFSSKAPFYKKNPSFLCLRVDDCAHTANEGRRFFLSRFPLFATGPLKEHRGYSHTQFRLKGVPTPNTGAHRRSPEISRTQIQQMSA